MPFCVTRETVWKLSKLKQKFLHFIHCVKSVHIRRFSGPSLAAFGLNTERYEKRSISPCSVQMREDTDQENSEHRHFSCSNISYPIVSDNTRSIATFWNPSKREIEGEKTFVELYMSFSGRFSYNLPTSPEFKELNLQSRRSFTFGHFYMAKRRLKLSLNLFQNGKIDNHFSTLPLYNHIVVTTT